jgi:hypothetical protein
LSKVEQKVRKAVETDVEAVLASLRGATADLARSTNIAILRMVLRSQLSNAIAHAGKTQHAAEVLHAAALAEIVEGENKLLSEEKG